MYALQSNIYVTSKCNKSCPSCYYPKDGAMNGLKALDVAAWIQDTCAAEHVKEFKAHFLGGEPLLNQEVLLNLMDNLYDLPGHPDGKFVVFTNGELLNGFLYRELKAYHARLMLNPTTNSLVWVEKKMAEIKEHMGGISLAVVADEFNLSRLSYLAALAIKYQGHIRVNRLYGGGKDPEYVKQFGKQMHRVFDVLLNSEYVMWPNFILESTYPLWEGPKNCHACGKWFVAIDPNGDIRSCNADLSTVMGNIDTHTWKDLKPTHRWSAKNLEECKDCEWSTGGWCQGGCPYTRKLAYGTYDKPSPFCSIFKELFPRLKELKERWIAVNGNGMER
jgi:radical SAM protein with 4Fe4S-binding SPASM domain